MIERIMVVLLSAVRFFFEAFYKQPFEKKHMPYGLQSEKILQKGNWIDEFTIRLNRQITRYNKD